MRDATIVVSMILLILLAAIPLMLYHAWAIWVLYGWFLVPHGLPELGIPAILGVLVLLRLVMWKPTDDKKRTKNEKKEYLLAQLAGYLCAPLFSVGLGWIIKGFM